MSICQIFLGNCYSLLTYYQNLVQDRGLREARCVAKISSQGQLSWPFIEYIDQTSLRIEQVPIYRVDYILKINCQVHHLT